MKNKITNVMNFVLLIVLMGVTFYVIFSKNDIGEIIRLITQRQGSIRQIIFGVLMAFGSIACEAAIICILFYILKENTNYYTCLKYSFIGFYYCAITPSATGGQPVQVYYMTKDNHKLSSSSLVVLVIIITYKVALLLLIGFLAIFGGPKMFEGFKTPGVKICFVFGVLINVACVALYMMILISSDLLKRMLIAVISFFAKIKIIRKPEKKIEKIVKLIDDYEEGVNFIKSNQKVLIPIMVITIIQRLMLFSVPYMIYLFLGGGDCSYIEVVAVQVVINTAADSLPIPGGIGINELISSRLYRLLYCEAMVGPAMVLSRGVNFYAMLVVSSIVSLVVYVRTNCRIKKMA